MYLMLNYVFSLLVVILNVAALLKVQDGLDVTLLF